MNGILLEQGFLGDGESPNHRVPPHRGGRRLPQKPPSLLGGSSLLIMCKDRVERSYQDLVIDFYSREFHVSCQDVNFHKSLGMICIS